MFNSHLSRETVSSSSSSSSSCYNNNYYYYYYYCCCCCSRCYCCCCYYYCYLYLHELAFKQYSRDFGAIMRFFKTRARDIRTANVVLAGW